MRWAAVLFAGLLAAGLVAVAAIARGGGDDQAAVAAPPFARPPIACADLGRGFVLCKALVQAAHGAFYLHRGDSWRELAALPEHRGTSPLVGHWRWGVPSPNGRFLLAQWVAECEVPIAYFVPVGGGTPRPVTTVAAESVALGWTSAGRARVALPRGACGTAAKRPGIYEIAPGTRQAEYAGPLPRTLPQPPGVDGPGAVVYR
jgi:hypothetical protein